MSKSPAQTPVRDSQVGKILQSGLMALQFSVDCRSDGDSPSWDRLTSRVELVLKLMSIAPATVPAAISPDWGQKATVADRSRRFKAGISIYRSEGAPGWGESEDGNDPHGLRSGSELSEIGVGDLGVPAG